MGSVEISEAMINVMKKIKDAITETEFEINHFNVTTTAAGGEMIEIDIRKHLKEGEEK
jgi:hypothetical protein